MKNEIINKYIPVTIGEAIEINGILHREGWTPTEVAEYLIRIDKIAKEIRRSVYFVWFTQRKYALATANDYLDACKSE